MIISANYEEGEPNEWIDKARCFEVEEWLLA